MLVRIQPSALFARSCPDGVAECIGLSEDQGPGSTPGRDTQKSPASVTDGTAVFETARRGSIPRRGTGEGRGARGEEEEDYKCCLLAPRPSPLIHPRGVADRTRPCEGRGSGSTPDEDVWGMMNEER